GCGVGPRRIRRRSPCWGSCIGGSELYAGGFRGPVTECDWRGGAARNLRGIPGTRRRREKRSGVLCVRRRLTQESERSRQGGCGFRRIDRGGARLLREL